MEFLRKARLKIVHFLEMRFGNNHEGSIPFTRSIGYQPLRNQGSNRAVNYNESWSFPDLRFPGFGSSEP